MATLSRELTATAVAVRIERPDLVVDLQDGRSLRFPIARYERLREASDAQLLNYELSPAGWGIHWPDMDEDLSVAGLVRDFGAN